MKIKLPNPLFDVGFELEFFLAKYAGNVCEIYNAAKVMKEKLGFSIDQNQWPHGHIDTGNGFSLITDGTPCELHWFESCNQGRLPDDLLEPTYGFDPVCGFQHIFCPFVQEGQKVDYYNRTAHFVDPQNQFNSQKKMRDAYTGREWMAEKKEQPVAVTKRTLGLHLNFSISQYGMANKEKSISDIIFNQSGKHLDFLVKQADEIYARYFDHPTDYTKARTKEYQTLGEYRVNWSKTESGLPLLEYRQLDSSMARDKKTIQKFIDTFQFVAAQYVETLL